MASRLGIREYVISVVLLSAVAPTAEWKARDLPISEGDSLRG
jgi:hypothetical protein